MGIEEQRRHYDSAMWLRWRRTFVVALLHVKKISTMKTSIIDHP